jgi:predicted metal-dependent phosphoesterase TrpH
MEIAPRNSTYIDLHIHSTASDGSLSPSEIIQTAKRIGLKAISITDHDTLEGSVEALRCSQSSSIEILSGIEISADFSPGGMHILGYLVQPDDKSFGQTLSVVQKARTERNLKIVKKLQRLGINIQYAEVRARLDDLTLPKR